ncbi:type II secretion system F family protein [Paenibacillus sp. WLX1005]|uniref:type II secretion system F family protein n=1 Tax=Paenibacillus sp. WLX1005 TaxID=3243766 RepID=UPI003983EFC6
MMINTNSRIQRQQTVVERPTRSSSGQQHPPSQPSSAHEQKLPDYTVYHLTILQRIVCMIVCGAAFAMIGYLFYHQWIVSAVFAGVAWFTPKLLRRHLLERRRSALSSYFKQALYSLSSSLAAGRSVENGFREAAQDLLMLYPDGDNDMIRELNIITTRLDYGQPIEEALADFSSRANNEDISNFADVFATCKRTGGDLVEVIRKTSSVIGEKLDIQQDIAVMIAQKKMESNILMATPFIFLLFLNFAAGDFMKPLYESPIGIAIATVCLIALGGCFFLIRKFMNIKV